MILYRCMQYPNRLAYISVGFAPITVREVINVSLKGDVIMCYIYGTNKPRSMTVFVPGYANRILFLLVSEKIALVTTCGTEISLICPLPQFILRDLICLSIEKVNIW